MKVITSSTVWALLFLSALVALPLTAFAYSIKYNSDKTEAKVFCDNGDLAGTFYWNGSQWSNGVSFGTNIDELAKRQIGIAGSACK
jgi:hypothetical protein